MKLLARLQDIDPSVAPNWKTNWAEYENWWYRWSVNWHECNVFCKTFLVVDYLNLLGHFIMNIW